MGQAAAESFAVAFAGQEKTSFSNHSTSTKKYCSGDKATRACLEHWNCKCDKQVRAKIKDAPILGVFVSFESANLNEHEVSKGNEVHMIPLGEDSSVIDDLNKEWRPPQSHGLSNLLPISCSLSCSKRHEVVRYILGANIMKIGHNLQTVAENKEEAQTKAVQTPKNEAATVDVPEAPGVQEVERHTKPRCPAGLECLSEEWRHGDVE